MAADFKEPPKRVGITGHQLIPSRATEFIKDRIDKVINKIGKDVIAVSSLASGSDQLFAAAVLEAGGKLHAIIPCKGYEQTFTTSQHLKAFRRLLSQAEKVELLDHGGPSEEAFLDAGHHVVNSSDILVAIWDGQPAKGKGGTADIVDYARNHGILIKIIWPAGVYR